MTESVNQNSVMLKRLDRWVNEKNNFGTNKADPMVSTNFWRERKLSRTELDALYVQDWLSRRVINIIAEDSTRNWITLASGDDNEKAEAIKKEFTRLEVQTKTSEAIILSRLHGGSLMIMGAFDGQETDMPLRKIRSVEFFAPVDRWQTFPQRFYADETKMNYGQPETYLIHRIQVRGTLTAVVHESRVVRFDGNYLPPIERMRNLGWNDSVLQNFYQELKTFGTAHQAVGAIIQDFITKKVQIKNLRELLSNEEGEQQLMARFAMLAYGTSIHNLAVFGDDEQYDKMGTPLTGLDKIMIHFVDIVSAASNIPKARLFHNQSGILGGDAGANDLRIHYDSISAYQETELRPHIQRMVNVIGESLGYAEDEVTFTFDPLWQLSELDASTARKNIADSDIAYINAGVVEPEEVAISRFGGDGIALADMIIDVDKRKRFLDQWGKLDIELNDGDEDEDEKEFDEEGNEIIIKKEVKADNPLPSKKENENKGQFIKRCMSDSIMNAEYSNADQRLAVCNTQWQE